MYAIPTAFVAALEFSGADTVVVFVLFNLLKKARDSRWRRWRDPAQKRPA